MNRLIHNKRIYICKGWSLSPSCTAFRREALGKPLSVWAVIIYHVVLLHPFQPLLTCTVQLLWKPWTTIGGRWRSSWTTRWCSRRPCASISFEVSVGSSKGCLAPVCLDKSTSCCPIISIPKTWVYPHWLVLWKWNPNWLWVLELSNGSAIHRVSEQQLKMLVCAHYEGNPKTKKKNLCIWK